MPQGLVASLEVEHDMIIPSLLSGEDDPSNEWADSFPDNLLESKVYRA